MSAQVLIIDDEPDLRALVRLILQIADYEVLEAETGEEGLRLVAAQKPDLVLLDIRLPDFDGWEVLKRMREEEVETPVLVLSAHSSPRTLQKAREEGAAGFLIKPFEEEELLRWAEELVR